MCFCVRVCFGLGCGGKRGMTDKRDDANRDETCKLWRARQGEAKWGRTAGTMSRGITPSRSLYQPECTFRRDRASKKKREEGSSGTPTKSEKVKERYMICGEKKESWGRKGPEKIELHIRISPDTHPWSCCFTERVALPWEGPLTWTTSEKVLLSCFFLFCCCSLSNLIFLPF